MIDSHVHFWDPGARRHAWLDEHRSLQRRFGPEDYDAGGHDVRGMIFVEADCRDEEAHDEIRWVAELATSDSRIRGIVAYAPLHLGRRARDTVAALAEEPGVVGVRRLLQDEPASLLRDRDLAEGVGLLGEHGLPFDLCIRAHQLRDAAALVAACPEITFVLDHLGKPAVATGTLEPWRSDLAALAAHPKVVCKLSGLATEAAPGWSAADGRSYVDNALELFGPHRCMAASDWPVCTLATSVGTWFDLILGAVAALAPAERDAVLCGTASRIYGSGPNGGAA